MPLLYRNCQVGSIWEGTTNVLSLDTWRAIAKDKALAALYRVVQDRLKSLTNLPSELRDGPKRIRDALDHIVKYAEKVSKVERYMEATARSFAYAYVISLMQLYAWLTPMLKFRLSRTFIALLTLEQAAWSAANPSLTPTSTTSDVFTAQYWLNHLHSVFMLPETPNLDAIKSVALDTGTLQFIDGISKDTNPIQLRTKQILKPATLVVLVMWMPTMYPELVCEFIRDVFIKVMSSTRFSITYASHFTISSR